MVCSACEGVGNRRKPRASILGLSSRDSVGDIRAPDPSGQVLSSLDSGRYRMPPDHLRLL